MKTSKLILIFALAALHTISFAQKKETSWLKNCSKLSYHVNYNTLEYDFILDSMAVSDGIGFNWKMTAPMNYSGKVKMSAEALDTATAQNNFFGNNSNLDLTDKTTIWVSKKVYKAIKKGKSVIIDPSLGREKLTFKNAEKLKANMNGNSESFDVLYATTESGNKFWILDDPANPLIMKMYLGWTIELIDITTSK